MDIILQVIRRFTGKTALVVKWFSITTHEACMNWTPLNAIIVVKLLYVLRLGPFCHREPLDHGVELKIHMLHGGRWSIRGFGSHWFCDFRAAGTLRFRLFVRKPPTLALNSINLKRPLSTWERLLSHLCDNSHCVCFTKTDWRRWCH